VFGKLKEYTSSEYKTKISTRIRFMILNIIELKDNNWVPRNARTKPAICTNKVLTNVKKPEYKPSTYVQYKPAEFPMVKKLYFSFENYLVELYYKIYYANIIISSFY
jgi:hypothetical protein